MGIGEIHLITGPMYSGKSSEIQKIINKFKVLKSNIMIFNHKLDKRYGEGKIYTHDRQGIDCIQTDKLMDFIKDKKYIDAEIVIIDEGHFFNDLEEFTNLSCDTNNKKVYIAGLNGDYERKSIGKILSLVPKCDTYIKLSALCIMCKDGTSGIFSKRISSSKETICVGSEDDYIAVCRKHYFN